LNGSPSALGILHDFIRAKANDPPSLALHYRSAPRICFHLVSVVIAINLDDQSFRGTREVGKIRANRMLSAELGALHSVRADQFPAQAFCAAGVAS
jgi:hypothetical protein